MPSSGSIDVVLSWSRAQTGTTAVLRQVEDGRWDEVARTDASEFAIRDLNGEAAHTFAAAGVEPDGSLAPEEEWETVRVAPLADAATPALPAAPMGFTATQDGATLNFRWDAASDGVTASYEIRVGDSWEDGQLVAQGLTGASHSWAWWASGDHAFHLKAVDRLGRVSAAALSVAVSIAPLDDHVTNDADDQAALGWPGTKDHLELDAGALRLAAIPLLGDLVLPIGEMTFPMFATRWHEGVYETPAFDAGQIEKQRVETGLGGAQPIDDVKIGDLLGPIFAGREAPFLARNTIAMAPLPPVDAHVEIDTSPTPGGPWDGWRPYAPGTYTFRRCRLRVTVVGDGHRDVRVPRLVLTRRKFNRKQEGQLAVNCSPVDVVFPVPFQNPPKVTATVLGYAGTPLVTNVTATGFTIAGGAAVFSGDPATFAPTVHWQALGT